MSRLQNHRGFTLVELMVVVVILSILATVAVTGYSKYKRNARRSEGVGAVNDIRMKQETFFATYSRYEDSTGEDESVFTGDRETGAEWTGIYSWNVDCPEDDSAWCRLGFAPPLHEFDGDRNYSYFQYQTIGWAPGRSAPTTITNANERWLHVAARGLPNSQSEWVHCTVIRFTNEANDTFVLTEQDCGS